MINQHPEFCKSFSCSLVGKLDTRFCFDLDGKPHCEYKDGTVFGCWILKHHKIYRNHFKMNLTLGEELKLLMWKNKLGIKDE